MPRPPLQRLFLLQRIVVMVVMSILHATESVGKELCTDVAGNFKASEHRLGRSAQITKFEIFASFFCFPHFRGNFANNEGRVRIGFRGDRQAVRGAQVVAPSPRTSRTSVARAS